MSIRMLSESTPVARKTHSCVLCCRQWKWVTYRSSFICLSDGGLIYVTSHPIEHPANPDREFFHQYLKNQ